MELNDAIDELKLIVSIFEKLMQVTNGELRADQTKPLVKRLQTLSVNLQNEMILYQKKQNLNILDDKMDLVNKLNVVPSGQHVKNTVRVHKAKNFVVSKPTSLRVKSIQQKVTHSQEFPVPNDVSHTLACTLYNILEGTVRLVQASSASIFMRKGDEMYSICNVGRNLVFPPIFNNHRCDGSLDAEVLGSCIALNRYSLDTSQSQASILIFPIRAHRVEMINDNKAIATLHIEGKYLGSQAFGHHDESLVYFSSILIGEFLSRVSQVDWLNTFYEPVTQHILAPFSPARSTLPILQKSSNAVTASQFSFTTPPQSISNAVFRELQQIVPQVLIKREVLPQNNLVPSTSGLSLSPSLREIRNFIDNIQSCWKKGVDYNVSLLQNEREIHMELKELRRNFLNTKKELEKTKNKLRLYELDGYDYKREYKDLRTELESYLRERNS